MQRLLKDHELKEIEDYFIKRYGVSTSFLEKHYFIRGGKHIWMVEKGLYDSVKDMYDSERVGSRVLGGDEFPYKPTSYFFLNYFSELKKGVVEISNKELGAYFAREEISVESEFRGYVCVTCDGVNLGCGLLRGQKLVTQYPKNLSLNFKIPKS